MPQSKKPRGAFGGNKFLIESREYKDLKRQYLELNFKVYQLLNTVQKIQEVMMALVADQQPAPPAEGPDGTIPQEDWDAYERDMGQFSRDVEEAPELRVLGKDELAELVPVLEEAKKAEAVCTAIREALAPQEAPAP